MISVSVIIQWTGVLKNVSTCFEVAFQMNYNYLPLGINDLQQIHIFYVD